MKKLNMARENQWISAIMYLIQQMFNNSMGKLIKSSGKMFPS